MDNEERILKADIIYQHMITRWDDEDINELWDKVDDDLMAEQAEGKLGR